MKETIVQIVKYIGIIYTAAQEVEKAVPDGATKKQIVIAVVLAIAHAGEQVSDTTIKTIAGLVDTVVGLLNTTGIFGKSATSVTVAPK